MRALDTTYARLSVCCSAVAVTDGLQSRMLKLHQALYEGTDGRLGHTMIGVPTLLLRSTGRRSGKLRCNALVYAKDGDDYVLVASNGGQDRPPAWLHNVRAKPEVEVQVARARAPGRVHIVERGDEGYERLWRLVNDNNRNRYDAYQAKTSRSIPLVVVSPTAGL